jgi:aminocarboxymuconate-semialdehyde decarboxylase
MDRVMQGKQETSSKIWNRYGPTAARPKGKKPGREVRPQSVTIDIHSHVAVPAAAEVAKPHLDAASIPLFHYATQDTKTLNARQDAERSGLMTSHDARLADLDAMGIDRQIVMCAPPQCYYTVPLDVAVKAARLVNEGVAEYVAKRPDRFAGLGSVPMPDGNEAARELEHLTTRLGLKGVQILTNVAGRELSDPAFAPFWKKAEELGTVVLLHPTGFTEAQRFTRYYFNNVIGNPLDTTVALHCLIFDGVLERHPDLKIIAVHGGGYLGAYSGRIDHAWGARSDAKGDLPKPPTSYLKKIYVDSVVFMARQLAGLVETFGADHVLMGTDYPYDMGEYDPVEHLAATASLDAAARAAIAGGNAKRLFGL